MAKVLIDIADELYTEAKDFKNPFPSDLAYNLRMPVANGIVLDDLTNGEVIQKMFPKAKVTIDGTTVCLKFEYYHEIWFDLDLWNSKWGE